MLFPLVRPILHLPPWVEWPFQPFHSLPSSTSRFSQTFKRKWLYKWGRDRRDQKDRGDMPLDRVWFSGIPSKSSCVGCMSTCASTHKAHGGAWRDVQSSLHWYLRPSLLQGPKSKRIFLNRVSYFPDYSLAQRQVFTVPAAHPHSITYRFLPSPGGRENW